MVDSTYTRITKAYRYNFEPLKPHFYIVKLGFTGVYIILFISAERNMKNIRLFLSEKFSFFFYFFIFLFFLFLFIFSFFVVKFSVYLNRHVFVMGCLSAHA